MIEIKQVNTFDEGFYNYFFKFCVGSKPYDFCELNSPKLRSFKIKEYFESLVNSSAVFCASKDSNVIGYVFLSEQPNHLVLEFAIGDNQFKPKIIIEAFYKILLMAQKSLDKSETSSTIQRKHKKQKLINWLKKYDKACEIFESEGKTQIIWTNERLS